MKRFSLVLGLMALAAATLPTTPARADFFTLDGWFQCLDRANAVCGDARKLVPQPMPKPAAPAALAPAMPEATAYPVEPAPAVVPPPSAARADDPLLAIAQRVQARRPTGADLAALKQAAHSGNPRAIELLAWCALNAIGTPRDAVEAYLLYGAAASAALPHARDNQGLIYERDLDSDQRQQVLDLVNDGVALARLSPAAR
jgi:TPR repeat protein